MRPSRNFLPHLHITSPIRSTFASNSYSHQNLHSPYCLAGIFYRPDTHDKISAVWVRTHKTSEDLEILKSFNSARTMDKENWERKQVEDLIFMDKYGRIKNLSSYIKEFAKHDNKNTFFKNKE